MRIRTIVPGLGLLRPVAREQSAAVLVVTHGDTIFARSGRMATADCVRK